MGSQSYARNMLTQVIGSNVINILKHASWHTTELRTTLGIITPNKGDYDH